MDQIDPKEYDEAFPPWTPTDEDMEKMYQQFLKDEATKRGITPEELEKILEAQPFKESHSMTRREELETKGVSQLIAERFAKGVPRGAYSTQSFERKAATRDRQKKLGSTEILPKGEVSAGDAEMDPLLRKVIEAYTSDPLVKIALNKLTEKATLPESAFNPRDLEHAWPNDPYTDHKNYYTPRMRAKYDLANAGLPWDRFDPSTKDLWLDWDREQARDYLKSRGFNDEEIANMTTEYWTRIYHDVNFNIDRPSEGQHYDERNQNWDSKTNKFFYTPNDSPHPVKPFAEEHPDLVRDE